MRVKFDSEGYVEMLVMKGDLPDSVELEDDDTIMMKYLTCYKLGYDGTRLVLDAEKVQRMENSLRASEKVHELRAELAESDYKVLRHIGEQAVGLPTTLSQSEYIDLEVYRESLRRKIREIEDCTDLETDVNAISQEGFDARHQDEDFLSALKRLTEKFKKEESQHEEGNAEEPSI